MMTVCPIERELLREYAPVTSTERQRIHALAVADRAAGNAPLDNEPARERAEKMLRQVLNHLRALDRRRP